MSTAECKKSFLQEWMPLVALIFCVFIFNTSEFVPIGLLSDIAEDFRISESRAGLLITVYAWVVALMSLPLMLLVSHMEYRRMLLLVVAVFAASHLLSAFSSGYYSLMASRIGVACSHAVFWSVASPLAVRVAPHGKRALALGCIASGTSVAMIVGLPLGRVVGLLVGWRMTFLCIAIAAAAVLLVLAVVFPKIPDHDGVSLKRLPSLLGSRPLLVTYAVTVVTVLGHFTCYSYIEPFLSACAGMSDDGVTLTLVAFGAVGLLGSVLFSKYYERRSVLFVVCAVSGISLFMLLLRLAAFSPYSAVALCVLWGLSVTLFNMAFQAIVIRFAPEGTDLAAEGEGQYARLLGDALGREDYVLAVRLRFAAVLRLLDERGIVRRGAGKTNRDYFYEIGDEARRRAFGRLCWVFDRVAYGEFPFGAEAYRQVEREFDDFEKEAGR